MTPSPTLREVSGLSARLPLLSESALIMIDCQNTYRSGVMTLDGADAAIAAAAALLERARTAAVPVIHIVNDGGEDSLYDIRAHSGAIVDELAPVDGEPVVVKQVPNAFHGTDLETTLRTAGFNPGSDLLLAGFMTHMCVTFTAQGAFNLGYRPTVIADTTATRTLATPAGSPLPAAALKQSALTTITDLFGLVVPNASFIHTV
ncbi:MAG: cysteine hydrolase [Mycobacteriaceae bacterium]|nr:cysteine hydrolase [Mycobacteriaceae bacterium]